MKVTSEIYIYKEDGVDTKIPTPVLKINSESRRGLVELVVPSGYRFTVSADELERAIRNAMNVGI